MNFGDLMNNIFGAEWLGTFTQILSGIVMIVLSALFAKLKTKLINSENKSAKTIGGFLEENVKINNKLDSVEQLTKEQKEQNQLTTDAVVDLCNIVCLGFLDSKSVNAETKLAISKVLGNLQAVGVDVNKINETVQHATEAASLTVEKVNEIKEHVEKVVETSTEAAEGIKEASLDVYNQILANE